MGSSKRVIEMAKKKKGVFTILKEWSGHDDYDERVIINPRGQKIRFVKQISYEVTKAGDWINPEVVIRKFLVRKKKKSKKKK